MKQTPGVRLTLLAAILLGVPPGAGEEGSSPEPEAPLGRGGQPVVNGPDFG